jgi:DNA-binding FadR family transcriptional regulator
METVNITTCVSNAPLRELLEIRRGLELEIVRLAALRRTDEELTGLEALLAQQRQAADEDESWRFLEADIAFHLGVAAAAHNATLLSLYEDFEAPLRSLVVANMEKYPLATHCDIHQQLWEAIRDRDEARAVCVAEQFLTTLEEQLGN